MISPDAGSLKERARNRPKSSTEQVVDHVVAMIDTREAKPGDRLPTTAELAEAIGVSRAVVLQALPVLERIGRISVRRGRGGVIALAHPRSELREMWLRLNRRELEEALIMREVVESGVARLLSE